MEMKGYRHSYIHYNPYHPQADQKDGFNKKHSLPNGLSDRARSSDTSVVSTEP